MPPNLRDLQYADCIPRREGRPCFRKDFRYPFIDITRRSTLTQIRRPLRRCSQINRGHFYQGVRPSTPANEASSWPWVATPNALGSFKNVS